MIPRDGQPAGEVFLNLAQLTQPLWELLGKNRTRVWDKAQEEAFTQVKKELCTLTVLSLYDPSVATKISAVASSYGLGAVLLQEQRDSMWKPVAYASRSMTKTETRYAQVEKEALAITWACDKFANYIIRLKVLVQTDHKPLIPLSGSKHLDELPPRILRLRLARVDYSLVHVPGKFSGQTLRGSCLQSAMCWVKRSSDPTESPQSPFFLLPDDHPVSWSHPNSRQQSHGKP